MLGSLFLPVVLGAGVLGMGVAFLAWLRRDRPGAAPLTVFVVTASCWALVQGLALAAGDLEATRFWTRVGLVLSAVIPLTWLVTVLEYTGQDRWLSTPRLAALGLEPLAFALLVWTNSPAGGHDVVWTTGRRLFVDGVSVYAVDWGLAFWAHQVASYLFVLAGGVLLLQQIVGTTALYRSQSTALLAAIALPMIANALAVFRLVPQPIDPTAVGYVLTGVVLAWAMFRSSLFSLSPLTRELGREEAIADLDDRVLVLDGDDRIVDANPAAAALLGAPQNDLIGNPLQRFLPDLAAALAADGPTEDLELDHGGKLRYFDARVSELSRARGTVEGRLVSLRDVTERRQREQRLDVLNRLLRHNMRNDLNVIRGNAELASRAVDDEVVETRLERIVETADAIARRSDKLGRLTRSLEHEAATPGRLEPIVESALDAVAPEYDTDGVTVDVPSDLSVIGAHSLSTAIEELVANAFDHAGEDPAVRIAVDRAASDEDWLVLVVADDGEGIATHEYRAILEGRETPLDHGSGVGLWLVNWIVTEIGGNVGFDATADGTTVRLLLPRADATAGARAQAADDVPPGGPSAPGSTSTGRPGPTAGSRAQPREPAADLDPNPDPSLPVDGWLDDAGDGE
jgi:PAS domain S-box-containing protein